MGYINRYLQQDYGDHVRIRYVDVDSSELAEYPSLAKAVEEGLPLPVVLSGDEVKTPPVLSFGWVVNELKAQGALE